jgi:uncharacterized membrane protein
MASKLPAPGTDAPEPEPTGGLPARIERALAEAVPQQQKLREVRREIASYVHEVQEYYAGPLPHPEHLEHFNRTLPGAADRILGMAELEQTHRHAWEERELRSSTVTERIGLFGGIVVAIGLIAGAIICAIWDQKVVGVALVAASAVSMVPAIIRGRDLLRSRGESRSVPPVKPNKPASAKRRPKR